MGLSVSKGNTGGGAGNKPKVQRDLPKKGPRPAVLTGLIDLGMQDGGEWQGEKKKDCRQILPIFTLMSDTYSYEDDKGEVHEGNCVTAPWPIKVMPGAQRGYYYDFCQALDPNGEILDEGAGDLSALLGRSCFANIVHSKPNAEGITYANCKGVQEIPEDYPIAAFEGDLVMFDTANPSKEIFDSLWERTQNLIRACIGYKGSHLEGICEGTTTLDCPDQGPDDITDDIPF